MGGHDAIAELDALSDDLARAVDAILTAAEQALDRIGGSSLAVAHDLHEIMAACAIGDLAGQRISKLKGMMSGAASSGDGLLNGPALTRAGLDQSAADAVFKQR